MTVALVNVALQVPETSTTILCSVSDLKILICQANGNPVKNAYVKLSWRTDVSWKLEAYSKADGTVLFEQMPHYNGYTLMVEWKGKVVYQAPLQFNGEKKPFQINCNIFDLTIKVFDKRNKPVPDAKIDLRREDSRQEKSQTNNDGIAVFNHLAIGHYMLNVS